VFEDTAGGFPWKPPAAAADGTIYQSGMPNEYTETTPNPNVTIALDPSGNLLWGWEMGGGAPILGADGTVCLWAWDANSGPIFTALRPDGTIRWSLAGSLSFVPHDLIYEPAVSCASISHTDRSGCGTARKLRRGVGI
jgi:hypothetical protein